MWTIGMNTSSLVIAATLLIHVLAAHVDAAIIDGGIYTIQVAHDGNGIEQCNDLYLAYLKNRASRRPFLMSSFAKDPPKWKMISLGRDLYKLETADRPSNISSKLSYSPACSSSSVLVDDRLRLTWRLIAVDREQNLYRVVTGNKDCPIPVFGRLAPLAVAEDIQDCDSERSLSLMPISSETFGMIWKFVFVSNSTDTSLPTTPPPTVQVEVPTVKIDVAFQGITVEQFGEEEQENICDVLIAASGYPRDKVVCTVQVTPLSSAGRRLHQDGVLVEVILVFLADTFEESQQAGQSANDTVQAAQTDGTFDNVTSEDTDNTVVVIEVTNSTQEVPSPTPTPTPDPESTEQPTETPEPTEEPTETPESTVSPTTAPPTTPPPTTSPPNTALPFYGDEGGTLTVPGVPKNVQVSYGSIDCETERSAYFAASWEPADDGVYVETYTVSCVPTSGALVEVTGLSNNLYSAEIGPLEANTTYTCSVTATNAAGESSSVTDPIIAVGCPSALVDVTATFPYNCDTAVRVAWNNSGTGSTAESYTVDCRSTSGTHNVTVPGSSVEAIVTGLDISSKFYTCFVTALNVVGSREVASNSFTTFNPVQIPAISGGCPTGQYCASLGNCTSDQCQNSDACGGLFPVCENNNCVAKCPSSFEEPAIPTTANEVTVNNLVELQNALSGVTEQFTKIILDGSIELSSTLAINKPVMIVGQNNAEIKCAASTNPNPLIYLGSNNGISISDGVVIQDITFDRTSCSGSGRILNFRARTDSNNKIIIRNNTFVGGLNAEGAPVSEGIVTGTGNNDWVIYGNSFINLVYGMYVNVVEFSVTNQYNGVFWGNSLITSRVGIQNSWPTQQLLFGSNVFDLNNISSFAFLILQTVQKADFACNSISGSKEGAFIYWDNDRTVAWNDIKLNYNNIDESNAAGFKIYYKGYLSDGSLPKSTDGTNNYWGAVDGPGGTYGSGNGTPLLLDNVTYIPFLDSPFVLEE